MGTRSPPQTGMLRARKGIPLAEARLAFATPALRRRYEQAVKAADAPRQMLERKVMSPIQATSGPLLYHTENYSDPAPDEAVTAASQLLDHALLDRWERGEIVLEAVAEPIQIGREIVTISPLVRRRLTFVTAESIARGEGITFAEIRVIKGKHRIAAPAIQSREMKAKGRSRRKVATRSDAKAIEPRKPGRPGIDPRIFAKFEALVREHKDAPGSQPKMSLRAYARLLQDWFKDWPERGNARVPELDTIARHLGRWCTKP